MIPPHPPSTEDHATISTPALCAAMIQTSLPALPRHSPSPHPTNATTGCTSTESVRSQHIQEVDNNIPQERPQIPHILNDNATKGVTTSHLDTSIPHHHPMMDVHDEERDEVHNHADDEEEEEEEDHDDRYNDDEEDDDDDDDDMVTPSMLHPAMIHFNAAQALDMAPYSLSQVDGGQDQHDSLPLSATARQRHRLQMRQMLMNGGPYNNNSNVPVDPSVARFGVRPIFASAAHSGASGQGEGSNANMVYTYSQGNNLGLNTSIITNSGAPPAAAGVIMPNTMNSQSSSPFYPKPQQTQKIPNGALNDPSANSYGNFPLPPSSNASAVPVSLQRPQQSPLLNLDQHHLSQSYTSGDSARPAFGPTTKSFVAGNSPQSVTFDANQIYNSADASLYSTASSMDMAGLQLNPTSAALPSPLNPYGVAGVGQPSALSTNSYPPFETLNMAGDLYNTVSSAGFTSGSTNSSNPPFLPGFGQSAPSTSTSPQMIMGVGSGLGSGITSSFNRNRTLAVPVLASSVREGDGSDQPIKKKKRARLACIQCSKKKIKCSGEFPKCAACVLRGVECQYPAKPLRRGPKHNAESTAAVNAALLLAHETTGTLMRGAKRLNTTQSTSSSNNTGVGVPSHRVPPHSVNGANHATLQSPGSTNVPITDTVALAATRPVMVDDAMSVTGPSMPPGNYPPNRMTTIGGLEMSTAEVNAMIDSLYTSADLQGSLYSSSDIPESEKLAINSDYETFMVKERRHQSGGSSEAGRTSSIGLIDEWIASLSSAVKVEMIASFFIHFAGLSCPLHPSFIRSWETEPVGLLHAVWALGAIHTFSISPHEKHRFFAGDPFYFKARGTVDAMLSKPSSITSVITLCLLSLYGSASGRETASFSFASQAIRMALELKLNIDPAFQPVLDSLSWMDREVRRRVWWLCFILDRWTSNDALFFVDESECLCQSPMNSDLWNTLSPEIPETMNEATLRMEVNSFSSKDLYLPSVLTNSYGKFFILLKIYGRILTLRRLNNRAADSRFIRITGGGNSQSQSADYQSSFIEQCLRQFSPLFSTLDHPEVDLNLISLYVLCLIYLARPDVVIFEAFLARIKLEFQGNYEFNTFLPFTPVAFYECCKFFMNSGDATRLPDPVKAYPFFVALELMSKYSSFCNRYRRELSSWFDATQLTSASPSVGVRSIILEMDDTSMGGGSVDSTTVGLAPSVSDT